MRHDVRMRIRGWVAVATVLLLGACSLGDDADEPTPSDEPIETAEPAPAEPAAGTATVEQWASQVAMLQVDFDDAQESWDSAACSSIAAAEAADCRAILVMMSLVAQTAEITLVGLSEEGGPTYFGEPPTEIAMLVADTAAAAVAASSVGQAIQCPGDQCIGTAFEFERAWGDLGAMYAGWAPYS